MSAIQHKKNTAYYLAIPMIDSTSPASFVTGESVADTAYYKDGAGAWTSLAIADTFSEIASTGVYEIDLTAAEMNHDQVLIKMTSTNAADTMMLFDMRTELAEDLGNGSGQVSLLTATQASIDAIEADTNELQGDWVDGGRLDLILDARMAEASINTTGGAVDTVTTLTNMPTIPADWITAAGIAADAGTEIGAAVWSHEDSTLLVDTTINTTTVNTLTLTAGSTDDDAYNGCVIVIEDQVTAEQVWRDEVINYTGATKTVALKTIPTWSIASGDKVRIYPGGMSYDNAVDLIELYGFNKLMKAAVTGSDVIDNSVFAKLVSASATADWDDFDNTTDSLQAIRDNINTEVDTALSDIGLDHLVSASVTGTDIADDSIIAKLVSSSATADWDSFVNTTDSLQAIRDAGGGDATAANQTTIINAIGTMTDLGGGADIANNLADMAGATFSTTTDSLEAIRNRGDVDWSSSAASPLLLKSTTVATLTSQTVFTLTDGSTDDSAYTGMTCVIIDSADTDQVSVATVIDYTGSTKEVTLQANPGIFTVAVGDTVKILATINGAIGTDTAQVGWIG